MLPVLPALPATKLCFPETNQTALCPGNAENTEVKPRNIIGYSNLFIYYCIRINVGKITKFI